MYQIICILIILKIINELYFNHFYNIVTILIIINEFTFTILHQHSYPQHLIPNNNTQRSHPPPLLTATHSALTPTLPSSLSAPPLLHTEPQYSHLQNFYSSISTRRTLTSHPQQSHSQHSHPQHPIPINSTPPSLPHPSTLTPSAHTLSTTRSNHRKGENTLNFYYVRKPR